MVCPCHEQENTQQAAGCGEQRAFKRGGGGSPDLKRCDKLCDIICINHIMTMSISSLNRLTWQDRCSGMTLFGHDFFLFFRQSLVGETVSVEAG